MLEGREHNPFSSQKGGRGLKTAGAPYRVAVLRPRVLRRVAHGAQAVATQRAARADEGRPVLRIGTCQELSRYYNDMIYGGYEV